MQTMPPLIKMIFLQCIFYTLFGLFHKNITFPKKIYWIFYSFKYIFAENIGRYIGTLEEGESQNYGQIDRYLLRLRKKYYEEVCTVSIIRDK